MRRRKSVYERREINRWKYNRRKHEEARKALERMEYSLITSGAPEKGEETEYMREGHWATLYPCGRINDVELDAWLRMVSRRRGLI